MVEHDAVERVAKALYVADGPLYHMDEEGNLGEALQWDEIGEAHRAEYRDQATAAITAYNAYLRERATNSDVVEAACRSRYGVYWDLPPEKLRPKTNESLATAMSANITAALDAMIGKDVHDVEPITDNR